MRIVLLVEDNPDDIYHLSEACEELLPDALLKVAKHGDEAIAYLSGRGMYSNRRDYPLPSMIIMDLGLPHRSGFELLAWVRQNKELAELPVAILTGSDRLADVQKATALGISGYFTKPVAFRELAELVQDPSRLKKAGLAIN